MRDQIDTLQEGLEDIGKLLQRTWVASFEPKQTSQRFSSIAWDGSRWNGIPWLKCRFRGGFSGHCLLVRVISRFRIIGLLCFALLSTLSVSQSVREDFHAKRNKNQNQNQNFE